MRCSFREVYSQVNLTVCWLAVELALEEHGGTIKNKGHGFYLGLVMAMTLGLMPP